LNFTLKIRIPIAIVKTLITIEKKIEMLFSNLLVFIYTYIAKYIYIYICDDELLQWYMYGQLNMSSICSLTLLHDNL